MFAQFVIKENIHELHKSQSKRCNKGNVKITAKDVDLEHVKQLGLIICPNAKLTSPVMYV